MPTASRADGVSRGEAGQSRPPRDGALAGAGSRAASWLTPAGTAIVAATAIGLGLRAMLLFRPGFLSSGTVEYDDGVYLGAAIRLLEGVLPYRDYAYVQPPGILVVSLPFALAAKTVSAPAALAASRIATVCASTACIPLAGRLVRHKGALVTLVTCGFLAVYPADVLTARTLLLEPWMNLFCLLAAVAAFSRGRVANSRRRLAWAGAALGFAMTVKFWAAVPAAALLCVLLFRPGGMAGAGDGRWRQARGYLAGLVAGFALPIAGFAAAGLTAFARSAIFDQVTRMGAPAPMTARAAYLTGMIPVIGPGGGLNGAGTSSAFAMGTNGTMVINGVGWVPAAVGAGVCAIVAAAYFRRPASRSPLEWFALAAATISVTAVSVYSAFFYHYPSFPAPWLAIALGTAAGAAAGASRRRAARRPLVPGAKAVNVTVAVIAAAVLAAAVLEGGQLAGLTTPASPRAADRVIPAGACVVTDQVALTLAADRFTPARPGCPDILDSLAETLSLSGGVSVPGGAGANPHVTQAWKSLLARAQYVWLTQGYRARIPWQRGLPAWFATHFRPVRTFPSYGDSTLFKRIP